MTLVEFIKVFKMKIRSKVIEQAGWGRVETLLLINSLIEEILLEIIETEVDEEKEDGRDVKETD